MKERVGECWHLLCFDKTKPPKERRPDGDQVFVVLESKLISGSTGSRYDHLCVFTEEGGHLDILYNSEWENEPFETDMNLARVG